MEQSVEYTIKLHGIDETEAALDRLIAKAERLRELMSEPANEGGLPIINYSVNIGNLKELMNAPADAFSDEFLSELRNTFTKIANTKIADKIPG